MFPAIFSMHINNGPLEEKFGIRRQHAQLNIFKLYFEAHRK